MTDILHRAALLTKSGLFDAQWYQDQYPDVEMSGIAPAEHYVRFGAQMDRSPGPLFDAAWYRSHHTDVGRSGMEPLYHFVQFGRQEGRKTLPLGGLHPTYALCVDRKGGVDMRHDLWNGERERRFLDALRSACGERGGSAERASVIMPTHNRAPVIAKAIASVVAQSHCHWELLVVDDGSTDHTREVVAPWLDDPRIRYFRQEQGGVSKARNRGLAEAGNPYVFYLDSDNAWRPHLLSTMLAFMQTTELDAAFCGSECHDDPGRPRHFRGDDFTWWKCLRQNYVDMNAFAHRRELSDLHEHFDERLLRLVDWDFILRLTRDARTAYAPFCGVDYYDGKAGGRISTTQYTEGALALIARRIQAKHRSKAPPREPALIAEELLTDAVSNRTPATSTPLQAPADSERVGYVVWDWPALSQTFVVNEVRELLHRGKDVIVYYRVEAETPATLDILVPAHCIADADALALLVREHGRTVLHSPFAYPATTLLTWPCSLATGLPFTFMPGGVDISHYDNMKRNRVGEVASSDSCMGVITLGSYHREFLIEQGVPAEKLRLERQSVDLPTFRPRYEVHARPRAISVARFIEKKGLCHLLDAAATLPGVDFHLYGYGPLERELRVQSARLGLDNVHFEPALVSTEQLHGAYVDADIFVLPCVRAANGDLDGLPTVILEAMASGVPVVSSDISNIPDVIIDGVTGFLATPGNHTSLARCIGDSLAMDATDRRALIDAARKLVEGYAGTTRTVDTLEQLWAAAPAQSSSGK